MNVSRPTLLKAIQELEDVAVICKKSQSDYWINPHYIFKGNRIKYYQTNCPTCIEIKAELIKNS
jgi:DNA-binding GntR family transcriptional regulator